MELIIRTSVGMSGKLVCRIKVRDDTLVIVPLVVPRNDMLCRYVRRKLLEYAGITTVVILLGLRFHAFRPVPGFKLVSVKKSHKYADYNRGKLLNHGEDGKRVYDAGWAKYIKIINQHETEY